MIKTTYKARAKYGNRKVVWQGDKFDSQKELDRWLELQMLQRAGKIQDLTRQNYFELIPAQYDENMKLIERGCGYKADFIYKKDGKLVVEDTKGFRTPEYIIKRKLMLQLYGIRIQEV